MASGISHVIYADQLLKKKPTATDRQEFLLGVLFPDIRYVSNVAREQTHNNFEDLDLEFEGLTDFEKGWKFHVWCDMRRNELLRDKKFFDIKEIGEIYYYSQYFLEDELVEDQFADWNELSEFLKKPSYREIFQELNQTDWDFWYSTLSDFFGERPIGEKIVQYCKAVPSLSSKIGRITEDLKQLRKNKKIAEILRELCLEMV